MLNTTQTGIDTDQPPVILAHGLFGSGKNLGGIARRLGQTRRVISVDMRNHGDSPHAPDHSYGAQAGDLAEIIEANGGHADVLGHSMGGKAAMMLALTRPALVRKLVALDIAPVSYQHSQLSFIDAMEAVDLAGIQLRSKADALLATQINDPGVRAFLLQSLDLKSDPPRWKFNLGALRDQMPLIVGWPDLPKGRFTGPALFLVGALSDYCAGSRPAEAIKAAFPQAEIIEIADAGHWLHADKPEETAQEIVRFLG